MNKSKLRELEDAILFKEHSDEEWKAINKAVSEEFVNANDEDIKRFIDSGAGDALTQIMEYID